MAGDPGLSHAISSVERDISEILQSGQYYFTNEIAGQLNSITNAMRHMRLDNNFLKTSQAWDNAFDTQNSTRGNI